VVFLPDIETGRAAGSAWSRPPVLAIISKLLTGKKSEEYRRVN